MGTDKRRMNEMIVEIGMKEIVKKKLTRSTWAGHVERMGHEKRDQMPRELRGIGGEEDRHCDVWLH